MPMKNIAIILAVNVPCVCSVGGAIYLFANHASGAGWLLLAALLLHQPVEIQIRGASK